MKIKLSIIILAFLHLHLYAQQEDAIYTVTFDSNWSQQSHPHSSGSLPNNAHWSRLVGATHNSQVSFFSMGSLVTPGIESVAESGNNNLFNSEVNNAINAGTTDAYIDLGDLATDLGQIEGTIQVSQSYPLLSLISMIAPSPDWIIAIDSVSLLDDADQWVSEMSITLYPYDAGTDNGQDYTSSNSNTNPAQPMSNLQGVAPFSTDPIGTITLSLDAVLSTDSVAETQEIMMYPNPTKGLLNIDLLTENGTLNLYDITGKIVDRKSLDAGISQLNYSDLSPGIYIISLETVSNQTTHRFIKQ